MKWPNKFVWTATEPGILINTFTKSLFLTVHNIHECKIKISFAGQKTLKKKNFKIKSFEFTVSISKPFMTNKFHIQIC